MIQAQLDAFDVGVVALMDDGCTPTVDAFDDTNIYDDTDIGISAVTLLPTVDCIDAVVLMLLLWQRMDACLR